MSTGAVLTAAGSGSRLGVGTPKALVPLDGTPLVVHAARRLRLAGVAELAVSAPPGESARVSMLLRADPTLAGLPITVVDGGASRQASVAAALAALGRDVDVVLVHDAARALAPPALIARVADAVRAGHDAVVPGLPVADTVKQVDVSGVVTGGGPADGAARVVATPPRAALRAVQTPQGFSRQVLDAAHAAAADRASSEATAATDDAALVEALGLAVWVVPGDEAAAKITTARDLAVAELTLRAEPTLQEPAQGDEMARGHEPATPAREEVT